MTIGDFIARTTEQLTASGITTARLDCLVLLEDELKKERAFLLAHLDDELDEQVIESLEQKIVRRCKHEPLAYIRGSAEFYGRQFKVTPDVLVPRPETELIVEAFDRFIPKDVQQVADIGCGSGCIGITLALQYPKSHIDLYDISDMALKVAKTNSTLLGAHNNISVYKRDLLKNVAQKYDVIVANLPYVPTHFPINQAAAYEPKLALFAGADGLSDYRRFWQQIAAVHTSDQPKLIITEAFPTQHHILAQWARSSGYAIEYIQDFIQVFKQL